LNPINKKNGPGTDLERKGLQFVVENEGRGSVRFAGKKAISSFVFDRDARFHWWYTRFDSALEIDLVRDGERIAATGHAVLEHMDFRGQPVEDK